MEALKLIILLTTFFLFGCSPLKPYKKVATDISVTEQKRLVIAPWVALNFPPKITKGDTVDILVVDTVELHAVDTLLVYTPGDTVVKHAVRERVITKTITRTITDTVEGTATVDAIRRQLSVCSDKYLKAEETAKTATAKKDKWFWLFIAACGIIAGGIIAKVKGIV